MDLLLHSLICWSAICRCSLVCRSFDLCQLATPRPPPCSGGEVEPEVEVNILQVMPACNMLTSTSGSTSPPLPHRPGPAPLPRHSSYVLCRRRMCYVGLGLC
ncbi:hypothetical protein VPH35_013835 [Triticum aestivum]